MGWFKGWPEASSGVGFFFLKKIIKDKPELGGFMRLWSFARIWMAMCLQSRISGAMLEIGE